MIPGPGGSMMFVCTRRRQRRPKCRCGRAADYLCDAVVDEVARKRHPDDEDAGLCSVPLCERCRTISGGLDHCAKHAAQKNAEKSNGAGSEAVKPEEVGA